MSVTAKIKCDNCASESVFILEFEGEAHEIEYCPHCGEEHNSEFEFEIEEFNQ